MATYDRHTRRDALLLSATAAAAISLPQEAIAGRARSGPAGPSPKCQDGTAQFHWRAGLEGQRRADLGNGTYLNPVLAGDNPDPSVLRDGTTYYKVSSSFDYFPGLVIWKSADLVNWTVVGPSLIQPVGSVLAPDLVKHDGRYFIYFATLNVAFPLGSGPGPYGKGPPVANYVIHADSIEGPWSDPIALPVVHIDPGHGVGEDGKRYLFFADGYQVQLSDDGLKLAGDPKKVYDGWPIPPDWVIEGPSLEGPKVLRKDGFFYTFWAQGGTGGPPTGHMVIVARSRSIHGPWENCPHNPIVRTTDADEPWWSRGHATPVEGPRGDWWLVYHGYENGFRTLGRQMLLEPLEWGADGWPRATGGTLGRPLRKPVSASNDLHGMPFSDDFATAHFGTRLFHVMPKPDYASMADVRGGALHVTAKGKKPQDSTILMMHAGDHRYSVTTQMQVGDGAMGGLLLYYDEAAFGGLAADDKRVLIYRMGANAFFLPAGPAAGASPHMKLVNDANVVSFFISPDGASWRLVVSLEMAGYNHNVFDRFLSLRPAIFAMGTGTVTYSNLRYEALPG